MSGMVMLSQKRNEIQTIIKPQRKDRRNCKMPAMNINKNNFQNEVMNVDEQPELTSKFGITSIPTLVVMKNGKIVQQVSGARPKDAILGMLFNDTAAHTGKVER